jgi:hypothetical protein
MSAEFDAVLVLGCGIHDDGSLPDGPKESVDSAAELYNAGKAPRIILAGNVSYKSTFTPPVSESEAMYAYARMIGLPDSALYIENESKDTLGNAYFTKIRYLMPQHMRRLAVMLGPNHSVERVRYIFRKVLGDQFDTTFIEHSAKRAAETKRENGSLKLIKIWLDGIVDGDHEAIWRIMRAKHPGYSANPDEAWRKIYALAKGQGNDARDNDAQARPLQPGHLFFEKQDADKH